MLYHVDADAGDVRTNATPYYACVPQNLQSFPFLSIGNGRNHSTFLGTALTLGYKVPTPYRTVRYRIVSLNFIMHR